MKFTVMEIFLANILFIMMAALFLVGSLWAETGSTKALICSAGLFAGILVVALLLNRRK